MWILGERLLIGSLLCKTYLVFYGLAQFFGRLGFHDCQSLFLGKQIGKSAHVDARQSYFCWRHLFSMLRVVRTSGRLFRHNDSVWKNISI